MEELAIVDAIPNEKTALETYSYAQIIEAFIASLDRKPRTLDAYRKNLYYFFDWITGQGIATPKRADIKAYKAFLMDNYRVSTVASYLAAVRCFFRWISRETGRPELNIADGIQAPKQTRDHKKDALTLDQARHVLEVMPRLTLSDKRNRAIITLMIHNALRDVEVTRLNVKDLYMTNQGPFIDVWGKGRDSADKSLKVALNPYNAVQEYLEARQEQDGPLKGTAPLFASLSPRDYGQRLHTRTVSQLGKQALKNAGYDSPRLTAHSFRHTGITLLLQNGGTLHDAQLLARHENPATTQIYDHSDQDRANRAVDTLAQALAD